MKPTSSSGSPEADGDSSWANELLSLGTRRELLDRELQRLMAKKRHIEASPQADSGTQDHSRAGAPGSE